MRYITLIAIATIFSTSTLYAQYTPAHIEGAPAAKESIVEYKAAAGSTNQSDAYKKGVVSAKSDNADNSWYVNPRANESTIDAMPIYGEQVEEPKDLQMYSPNAVERRCIRAKNMAMKDNYNSELKYYMFGRPAGDYPHQIRKDILKEKYGVDFVMMGCAPVDSMLCYNREADKLLQRKYGDHFWDKLEKEVMQKAKAINRKR